jgi:hypothetical protein
MQKSFTKLGPVRQGDKTGDKGWQQVSISPKEILQNHAHLHWATSGDKTRLGKRFRTTVHC